MTGRNRRPYLQTTSAASQISQSVTETQQSLDPKSQNKAMQDIFLLHGAEATCSVSFQETSVLCLPSIKRSNWDSRPSALIIIHIHSDKICMHGQNEKNVTHVHGTHEYTHALTDCLFTGRVKPCSFLNALGSVDYVT